MGKNLFIVFEGIDGCGKSTQIELLVNRLKGEGYRVYSTFEPTDGPIGSIIRNIFTHRIEADNRTIAALFVADRLDHLLNNKNGILKKLDEGYIVISDRYYFSSYAYHAPYMPLDWIIQANSVSANLLRPDLNIYIDITPEISMERLKNGRSSIELFENFENLKKVRKEYLYSIELLQKEERIYITDGNRQRIDIANDIWDNVCSLIN